MKIYTIFNRDLGLYSMGTMNPHWVSFQRCKKWKSIGHVKNHLNMHRVMDWDQGLRKSVLTKDVPDSWEIREFEVQYELIAEISAKSNKHES